MTGKAERKGGDSTNKLLVSACLLGDPVRYDGRAKSLDDEGLERLIEQGRVVRFCPEVAGGLPVPRPAAEIQGGDGDAVIAGVVRVRTGEGEDVSDCFIAGAEQTLELCRQQQVSVAVLSEGSPSCGSGRIYDGSFTRRSVAASGVTTALLRQHGIEVFSQHQLADAISYLG
ncbi:MAG: DUF523 domain-containing protein [Gammaproteobacteria bacterium]|nr:DUF523 domain-containing protein [Gammaproteobacteria bacterium]